MFNCSILASLCGIFQNKKGEMMTISLITKSSRNELICDVMVKVGDVINGMKGLYIFDTKVFGLEGKLVTQGTYTFMWSLVNLEPCSFFFSVKS
jgi:hypothetical protein